MDISKLLEKENLEYYGHLIKKLSKDILRRIMIALFLIAIITDTMIAKTFPAFTLIAGIICLTVNSCKNLIIKEEKRFLEGQKKE